MRRDEHFAQHQSAQLLQTLTVTFTHLCIIRIFFLYLRRLDFFIDFTSLQWSVEQFCRIRGLEASYLLEKGGFRRLVFMTILIFIISLYYNTFFLVFPNLKGLLGQLDSQLNKLLIILHKRLSNLLFRWLIVRTAQERSIGHMIHFNLYNNYFITFITFELYFILEAGLPLFIFSLLFGLEYITQLFLIVRILLQMSKLQRFDKLISLYQMKYGLDFREFIKFIHEKIDSPNHVLEQLEKYIMDIKMKMTVEDLSFYLNIVSAAQQEINYRDLTLEEILKLKHIKLHKKSKVKKENKVLRIKQEEKQKGQLMIQIHEQELQINRQKIDLLEIQKSYLNSINRNFQLLKQQTENNEQFTLMSSQQSIELLYDEQQRYRQSQISFNLKQEKIQIIEEFQANVDIQINQIRNVVNNAG